jgi:hypothetical protein
LTGSGHNRLPCVFGKEWGKSRFTPDNMCGRIDRWGGVVRRSLVALVLVGTLPFAAYCVDPDDTDTKAVEWERAAHHREWASSVQQGQARDLMELAQELRKREYLYDADRRGNMGQAGDLENRAGDLRAGACANLEKAVADWERASAEYKRLQERERYNSALIMTEQVRGRVLVAYRLVAEAYESAADAYGENGADDPNKEVMATIKAATWREKLASKK